MLGSDARLCRWTFIVAVSVAVRRGTGPLTAHVREVRCEDVLWDVARNLPTFQRRLPLSHHYDDRAGESFRNVGTIL
jgi:hypothetical protein